MIQVSVIIVNYNTAQWVDACIRSVLKYTRDINYEIIVVDNQSPDRSILEVVAQFERVILMQMDANIGFGAACNKAAAIATGDFYLFLNPDTELLNNALKSFHDFWMLHNQSLNISCLGAVLRDKNGNIIHSYGQFPDMSVLIKNKCKSLIGHFYSKGKPVSENNHFFSDEYLRVEYVTGADLFISKINFDVCKGFDERFFMYFEETDLQWRLAKNGRGAFVIKGPEIRHTQGSSFAGNTIQLRVYYFNSLLRYFKNNTPKLQYLLFTSIWCILDAVTLIQKYKLSSKTKIR